MNPATDECTIELLNRIQSREARIGIVGMGYVGLPLALLFVEQRFRITGFDVDAGKVATINEGGSYIKRIPATEIRNSPRQQNLWVASGSGSRPSA